MMDDDRPESPKDRPAQKLIEVMGRKKVQGLAMGSLVAFTLVCLLAIFWPILISSQTSRFFLCILAAFFFSVFIFVLFPSDYKLDLSKTTSISIVLVGPAALCIAIFFLLWWNLPKPDIFGTVFVSANQVELLNYSTTWVESWTPVQPKFYKLKISEDQNTEQSVPVGFYVQFDPGHDAYTAILGRGPNYNEVEDRYKVVFVRGASTFEPHPIVHEGGKR